jgi:hypothetical protein
MEVYLQVMRLERGAPATGGGGGGLGGSREEQGRPAGSSPTDAMATEARLKDVEWSRQGAYMRVASALVDVSKRSRMVRVDEKSFVGSLVNDQSCKVHCKAKKACVASRTTSASSSLRWQGSVRRRVEAQ